jgi:hypothetical protein
MMFRLKFADVHNLPRWIYEGNHRKNHGSQKEEKLKKGRGERGVRGGGGNIYD